VADDDAWASDGTNSAHEDTRPTSMALVPTKRVILRVPCVQAVNFMARSPLVGGSGHVT
jgi:hypothetical protein